MRDTRRLQQTLFELQKRFGDQVVRTLAERGANRDALTFGYTALDEALGSGGVLRGHISVLISIPTSGATTLTHHLLTGAQGRAEAAVYLDPARSFDADYAATCGVALDRLLLVQPQDALQAIEIARDLAKLGRAALIVLDLLDANCSGLADPVSRLHESLVGTRTTILFLVSAPLDALDTCAQTCLRLERVGWMEEGRDVIGCQVRITILKDKPYPPGKTVALDIRFDPSLEGDNR